MPVVGLKTLRVSGDASGLNYVDLAVRAHKKRVFTDDEWKYLQSRPTAELHYRIAQGDFLIALLARPEMLNMTPTSAAKIQSNLRFQQDAIREIITARSKSNGSG